MNNIIVIVSIVMLVGALFYFTMVRPASAAAQQGEKMEVDRLLETREKPLVLVDVRTREEYESGHIPGAVNIPHDEIGARPPTSDRQALVVVYCRSGSRSASAEKSLRALGFANVINYGPVSRWKKDLVRGSKPE
jgi:phage shock protein E